MPHDMPLQAVWASLACLDEAIQEEEEKYMVRHRSMLVLKIQLNPQYNCQVICIYF
jgi:hypothetical protein